MEEGNSLLSEDFLEKLTILRMDNKFMGFMRAHRNDRGWCGDFERRLS